MFQENSLEDGNLSVFSCLIIQFIELISLIFGSSSAKNDIPILTVLSGNLKIENVKAVDGEIRAKKKEKKKRNN